MSYHSFPLLSPARISVTSLKKYKIILYLNTRLLRTIIISNEFFYLFFGPSLGRLYIFISYVQVPICRAYPTRFVPRVSFTSLPYKNNNINVISTDSRRVLLVLMFSKHFHVGRTVRNCSLVFRKRHAHINIEKCVKIIG